MSVVDDIIAADKLRPNPLLLYDVLSAIIDTMDSPTQIGPNFNKDRTTPRLTPRREWLIARAKCLSQVIDDCLCREEVVAVLGMVVELQSLLDLICAESPINHSLGGGGPMMMGRSR